MSFVGLITQKEEVTGVNLMAKIVTANKKKSARKVFPVRVKASGLTDADCCIIDLATVVDRINAQKVNEIVTNLDFAYSGANGTTITYEIVDSVKPYLSSYLQEDGTVLGRPKYGDGDAIGSIKITVSKGDAAPVTSIIQATVKAYTAKEVLADTVFSYQGLWTKIKGDNANGVNNIASKLNFVTTVNDKTVTDKTTEQVEIAWSVVDSTLQYTDIYTEPRINVTTGEIIKPTYKDACTLIGTNVPAELIGGDNNSVAYNRVRIGGITLTATITLGDEVQTNKYECATISQYLSTNEIAKVITNNINIKGIDANSNNKVYKYSTSTDATEFNTIVAPAEGGLYTLVLYSNTASETLSAPELKLNVGDITDVSVVNYLRSYTNINSNYEDTTLLLNAFNGGQFTTTGTDTFVQLTIDLDQFIGVTDATKKQFAIETEVSINKYSKETTDSGVGLIEYLAYFKIDTSAMDAAAATAAVAE